jgi:phosphopantothenoylcysteine synthetase/decarboxylase
VHVGFALEVQDPLKCAREKLAAKRLDFIVLNSPAAFAAEEMDASIIDSAGAMEKFEHIGKEVLADAIIERIERIRRDRVGGTK